MTFQKKSSIYIITLSLLLTGLILSLPGRYKGLLDSIHWNIYDTLLKVENGLRPAPAQAKDILLVVMDNPTLENMEERWPYPRGAFAKVIENLKSAGAKVIAFDFVFLGKSTPEDDLLLKTACEKDGKVILAKGVTQEGLINPSVFSDLVKIPSGIITKIQDPDGTIRKNITYLISEREPLRGFFSWEMQILKVVKNIRLSSLKMGEKALSFRNDSGEEWAIPVEPETKSFLIHFRENTFDFRRLSFYNVLKGDFDASLVKDRIIIVGFLSSLFGDIDKTPIGWLPGITLNVNAFLALYTHDFLKEAPRYATFALLIMGVILAGFLTSLFSTKTAVFLIMTEIFLFFALSYILIICGYVWNYSLFPVSVLSCPYLSKKIYLLLLRILHI